MPKKNRTESKLSLTVALILTVSGSITNHTRLQAQTTSSTNSSLLNLSSQFKPPNNGAPGNRKGGGTRSGCPGDKSLTGLIPLTNLGWTIAEHPTFWFYVPYQVKSPRLLEFVLRDDLENPLYKTTFQFIGKPGIVSLQLPETALPLEIGKNYRVSFTFFCDPANHSEMNTVTFWVKRVFVSPELKNQLTVATPKDQIVIYAQNGLWYDLLTALAKLRLTSSDASLEADWNDLLKHPVVHLDDLVSVPLVPCCLPKQTSK